MANKKILLYSYFRSSCAYRVRIALNLKGLPYSIVPVHLLKEGGQQHSTQYMNINPSRQVPTLIDGETVIGQSMAILEYLEEEFPNPPLLPRQKEDRAVVRQMCEIINSGMQPLQNLSVTQFLDNEFKVSAEAKNKWLQKWIHQGFQSLENLLKIHSARYCLGDQITLADCFLVPQVFSAHRFKIDLSNYPRCAEINERCLSLTDFIRATPEKQPDYEP